MGRFFRDIYKKLVETAPSKNDRLPFHYNDFAARPGTGPLAVTSDPTVLPGINTVSRGAVCLPCPASQLCALQPCLAMLAAGPWLASPIDMHRSQACVCLNPMTVNRALLR
jgi:hypothetical protein